MRAFLCAGAAAVLLGGCYFTPTGETKRESVSLDLGSAGKARVEIRMGAGELRIKSGTPKLVEASFAYNVPGWKPVVDYRPTGELRISQPEDAGSAWGNTVYEWDLTLNRDVPTDVIVNLGAGEARLELGQMNLSSVRANVGAGEVDVDLRGEPTRDYSVEVRGGVGEATIHLPKLANISATAAGGIGDISVDGLEKRDGAWVNPDAAESAPTIRVDVKGGVGQIRLIR
jgi:hypothetical protein